VETKAVQYELQPRSIHTHAKDLNLDAESNERLRQAMQELMVLIGQKTDQLEMLTRPAADRSVPRSTSGGEVAAAGLDFGTSAALQAAQQTTLTEVSSSSTEPSAWRCQKPCNTRDAKRVMRKIRSQEHSSEVGSNAPG